MASVFFCQTLIFLGNAVTQAVFGVYLLGKLGLSEFAAEGRACIAYSVDNVSLGASSGQPCTHSLRI
ncbi:MAG: hypothetical protein ACI4Q6_05175 [Huintestinicola sp.]